jgi:Tol biopolymer transport system component
MPLEPGARLGPYEILDKLGEGGMGEVYRARDPRLNRDVAIKILPEAAALAPERRERFQREAQAVAALNHPNIVTIHSVETEGGTAFLTMELVDGRPLSDVLPKNGFPLRTVLAIGIDVADAVAAAQQKGITHRDLKPANIMVAGDPNGRVKVLDFGLAKLEDDRSRADAEMPTALLTGEGRILGTVAYMSPEQAEGKPIDPRSDLFSLGVILYEMATGRRPFTGDTSVSIVSSIVKDTPPSVTSLNPELPRELGRIIRRALAKDPEARYQTAKDLRNDLKDLRASLESGELALENRTAAVPPRRKNARVWQAVAIVAILAAIGASALLMHRSARAATATPAPIEMTRITNGVNAERPTLSPDGKFVAYVQVSTDGDYSVWVRQLATGSNVEIVTPEVDVGIFGLTITPDGAFVDMLRWKKKERSAIWRVPLLGGPARKIVDEATSAPGWSPDGRHLAFLTQRALQTERSLAVANADGGGVRIVSTRKLPLRYATVTLGSRPDIHPVWLPDGRSVVVSATDEREVFSPRLVKVDTVTGAETPLLDQAPPLLARAGFALALGCGGECILTNVPAEAGGPPQVARVRLSDGAITWLTASLDEYDGVAAAGDSVISTRGQLRARFWVGDAEGRDFQPVGAEADRISSLIAWTGPNRILYSAASAGGTGLWATDLASGASQFLVPGVRSVVAPSDGKTILYEADDGVWRADADATHRSRLTNVTRGLSAIAPDGKAVFFMSGQSGVQTAWKADLDGTAARQFVDTRVNGSGIAVSPDSRWVALTVSVDENRMETIITPIEGGPPARRLPPIQSFGTQWTPDGKAIASVDATGTNLVAYPIDGSPSRALTHFTDQRIFAFSWSPDGKRLVLWRGAPTSDIVLLKGVH